MSWCVGLVNMVGRLLAVRLLKFAIILHMHVQYIPSCAHKDTHLTEALHINVFWQGQDGDYKEVSVCGG